MTDDFVPLGKTWVLHTPTGFIVNTTTGRLESPYSLSSRKGGAEHAEEHKDAFSPLYKEIEGQKGNFVWIDRDTSLETRFGPQPIHICPGCEHFAFVPCKSGYSNSQPFTMHRKKENCSKPRGKPILRCMGYYVESTEREFFTINDTLRPAPEVGPKNSDTTVEAMIEVSDDEDGNPRVEGDESQVLDADISESSQQPPAKKRKTPPNVPAKATTKASAKGKAPTKAKGPAKSVAKTTKPLTKKVPSSGTTTTKKTTDTQTKKTPPMASTAPAPATASTAPVTTAPVTSKPQPNGTHHRGSSVATEDIVREVKVAIAAMGTTSTPEPTFHDARLAEAFAELFEDTIPSHTLLANGLLECVVGYMMLQPSVAQILRSVVYSGRHELMICNASDDFQLSVQIIRPTPPLTTWGVAFSVLLEEQQKKARKFTESTRIFSTGLELPELCEQLIIFRTIGYTLLRMPGADLAIPERSELCRLLRLCFDEIEFVDKNVPLNVAKKYLAARIGYL